jgi:hypothetical protein
LAPITRITRKTNTRKTVDSVNTSGTIAAGIGSAVVDVGLALWARESDKTSARVAVQRVSTSGTVTAGIGSAFIDLGLTPIA